MKIRLATRVMSYAQVAMWMPTMSHDAVAGARRAYQVNPQKAADSWRDYTRLESKSPATRPLLNSRDRRRWLREFKVTCAIAGDAIMSDNRESAFHVLRAIVSPGVALKLALACDPDATKAWALKVTLEDQDGSSKYVIDLALGDLVDGQLGDAQLGDWVSITGASGVLVNLNPPRILTRGETWMRATLISQTGQPVVWDERARAVRPWTGAEDEDGPPIGTCVATSFQSDHDDDEFLAHVRIGDVRVPRADQWAAELAPAVSGPALHDAAHVRHAMTWFARTAFDRELDQRAIAVRIIRAAQRYGVNHRGFATAYLARTNGHANVMIDANGDPIVDAFGDVRPLAVTEAIEAINRRLAAALQMPLETLFGQPMREFADEPHWWRFLDVPERAYAREHPEIRSAFELRARRMNERPLVPIPPLPFEIATTLDQPIPTRGRSYGSGIVRYPASALHMADDDEEPDGPVTPREASGANDGGGPA